jgi:hypothetical protein
MGTGGMINVQRFIKISWYYGRKGFVIMPEIGSGAMLHIPSFIKMVQPFES